MPWWSLSSKSGKSPDAQDGTAPLLHPAEDWHAATTKARPSSRKRPRQSWSAPSLFNDTLSAGPATPTHSPPPPFFSRAACVREKGPPSPSPPSLSRQDLVCLLRLALNMQQSRWVVPVTLLLSTAAYEVAGNRIMVVTSDFYVAITGRDTSLYLHTLWLSLLIVLAVVVCKTFKTLSVELLALQCRRCLQRHFHDLYFIPPSFPTPTPPCAIAHVLDEDKGGEEAGKESSGQRGARDWPNRLSRGEAQRLCLARALYHQPRLLFLDEATSAVEESMERRVYELLRRGWGEGRGREGGRRVTVVSTGHRASLVGLHDRVIDLEGPHR
ncbi:hypothetical protein NSK_005997 [Nannochloropsis salina CCMP1776]|uniref:ABC transporter domain-containing protein n=1 Tax=Nannochloropsis salina CCMP1776 TaxID=1027361 RepID=A0A4D9CTK0_9STRA|nr:hypothetical protein NSK_005997 [Nannochloropsis salina CCMP1776]|eukprot:TFJ82571.1 hypothetical protein NSK_005997 [Nannochloropsis salina CCMP1776]